MGPTGKAIFLTKGVGRHREKLTSFELALRDARIAEFNIVRVSSIFPPGCKVISVQEGLKQLTPGQIVYAVMYDNATNEPHRLVAASVGLAIPANKEHYGYLSEHKSFGETDHRAGDYAEDLAATMLATILGVDSTPIPATTSARTSGSCPTRSLPRATSLNRGSAIAKDCGPRWWLPRCSSICHRGSFATTSRIS